MDTAVDKKKTTRQVCTSTHTISFPDIFMWILTPEPVIRIIKTHKRKDDLKEHHIQPWLQ
jgi:hypothetical protein